MSKENALDIELLKVIMYFRNLGYSDEYILNEFSKVLEVANDERAISRV